MKNERGSIAVLAFVTVMFILIILATLFYSMVEKSKAQVIEMEKLSSTLDGDMGEIYKERKNVKGIYVTLYSDGSLVFSNTNKIQESKGTYTQYGDISSLNITETEQIPWNSSKENITSVEFASAILPKSTAMWFSGCSNLTTITNIDYLNTSKVTNMASMFEGCSSLTTLDLSTFNTENVTTMQALFNDCTNLTTIYVSSNWTTTGVTNSENLFSNCTSIVGGNGTIYNTEKINIDYAKIDDADAPGYFTAKGIIITGKIIKNGDWQNPVATVTGTITSSTATAKVISTGSTSTITNFPTTGGSYTIPNITEDTEITITAIADDGKPAVTKTIKVVLVRDITGPTISGQTATVNKMRITIKADVTDAVSGVASFTYSVTCPTGGDIEEGVTGSLESGVEKVLTTTISGNYTITFTATDNANNPPTTATVGPVTIDTLSIAELKSKINASNYPDYLGTKVGYKTDDTVAWRVFYYDAGDTNHPNGFFGDGIGTIYLKRDHEEGTTTKLSNYKEINSATANGLAMMKQLNPDWNSKDGVVNLENEKVVTVFCDTDNWTTYYDKSEAKYAIGGAPIEMWTEAYNTYLRRYEPNNVSSQLLNCGIYNENGYGWGKNKGELSSSQYIYIERENIEKSKVIMPEESAYCLASHTYGNGGYSIGAVTWYSIGNFHCYTGEVNICPVVCLKHE